ncbi:MULTISPECIES: transcriptional regulator YeiL [Clostridium]|uniref:transcriptional regulator YeiL n=1 Tax=Clostridium TaxID=1485 RepID=UPI0018AC5D59|nr:MULTISPECIES: transcriptional regulator YeiL [Clostridium]MBS5305867.1 transcriptional regulator YeiL [Clostridium sp.]MDB1970266.1 transcriptional regulator YeiL [Clostridium tertium]MDU1277978.1 transcriptional regulator YeiL [Clostridium sp.]MDU1568936.1 transcriptional regulator YeiL [Clostridium sp.]MDU7086077.1 transcriptional regulator YeiL [Clostridium sp.]
MQRVKDINLIEKYIRLNKIGNLFNDEIRKNSEILFFNKRELIFQEGEEIKYLMFFVEGKAKVYTTLKNGKLLLLDFYKELDTLGDLELITNDFASCNVEAIEPCICIGIPLKVLRNIYYNDTNLMNFLCNSLGKKLKRSSKNASINLMYPLENRVASYIISIGTDKNSEIIKFDETLTVISELLGTSYRHLLRTLNRLCNKNILKKEEDYYIIIDYKNLEELAADIYS